MLKVAAAYLWEIVSSIKGNCFKTSDLLMEINFGPAHQSFSCGVTFGDYWICIVDVLMELYPMVPLVEKVHVVQPLSTFA